MMRYAARQINVCGTLPVGVRRMDLNNLKTNFMNFTPLRMIQDKSLQIGGNDGSLKHQECVRFLWVTIDQHLSWNNHIEEWCRKLWSKNYEILLLRDHVDQTTRRTYCYSSIWSILTYGLHEWGTPVKSTRYLSFKKELSEPRFDSPSISHVARVSKKRKCSPSSISIYRVQGK